MKTNIKIHSQRIIQILCFIVCCLTIFSIIGNCLAHITFENSFLNEVRESYIRLFLLDLEANIPTWFSSLLLFLASLLFVIIGIVKKKNADRFALHWIVLSFIFLFLSMDETAIIHEMAIKPMQSILNTSGYFRFAWIIPAAFFVLIFFIAFLKFLINLPTKVRNLFILAGVIYVGGSLVLEAISGQFSNLYGEHSIYYEIITTFEELFEMSGIVILIKALLLYIKSDLIEVRFIFTNFEI